MNAHRVQFIYTNHRGQTDRRRVLPHRIVFMATEWHPDPTWILEAYDLDKLANRSFPMAAIRDWTYCPDVIQEP